MTSAYWLRSAVMVCDCTASGKAPISSLDSCRLLDLVEARFCRRRAGVRHAELIVQLRKLLFVDELSAGAEDIVAGLERLDPILGLAHAILELVETRRQRLRNLPGGIGPDVRLFRQISLRNRVGDARRFGRISAADTDVDDVGAFGAFHLELALQRIECARAGSAWRAPPSPTAAINPRRAEGWPTNSGSRSSDFGTDHAAQHAVGAQHPHLALDLQHGRVVGLIGRIRFVAHRMQIRRVDENLCRRRDIDAAPSSTTTTASRSEAAVVHKIVVLPRQSDGPDAVQVDRGDGSRSDGDVRRAGEADWIWRGASNILTDSLNGERSAGARG